MAGWGVALCWGASSLPAKVSLGPLHSPDRGTIERIVREAETEEDWESAADRLRGRAVSAYREHEAYAEEWWLLWKWASFFARNQGDALRAWGAAVEEARLAWGGIAGTYTIADAPLGDRIPAALKLRLLSENAFGHRFFAIESAFDQPIAMVDILVRLDREFPNAFWRYPDLALAIAVVYDVPPPPSWPHGQVPRSALARAWPEATTAFDSWSRWNDSRQSYQDLGGLGVAELRFLVDSPLHPDDVAWARSQAAQPLSRLGESYDRVPYDRKRYLHAAYTWPGTDYRLKTVLAEGGICVDQAWFASQVGKIRGTPTMIFRGAGFDGRHAWFGFLDSGGEWRFDAGRFGDDRFVTGYAHDPQTWLSLSDHEIAFRFEPFQRAPDAKAARFHTRFAILLADEGHGDEAQAAIDAALGRENRWRDAHDLRILLLEKSKSGEALLEAAFRAARALQEYPEISTRYFRRASEQLRKEGRLAEARRQHDRLVDSLDRERIDLGVRVAATILEQSILLGDPGETDRLYRVLLRKFDHSQPMTLFDRLARPYALRLYADGEPHRAIAALEQFDRELDPAAESMLARELLQLQSHIAAAAR